MRKLSWFATSVILCAELVAPGGDTAWAQGVSQSGAVTVIRAGTLIDGLALAAVKIGGVRLIDNMLLN